MPSPSSSDSEDYNLGEGPKQLSDFPKDAERQKIIVKRCHKGEKKIWD